MFDLFSFIEMAGTYEDRKVDRSEFEVEGVEVTVSTCAVTDSDNSYETAICFDEGSFTVVEMYGDRKQAQAGHDRWVVFIQSNKVTNLENYQDQGTNPFAKLCRKLSPNQQ